MPATQSSDRPVSHAHMDALTASTSENEKDKKSQMHGVPRQGETELGHLYTIREKLGSGSYGTVYKALKKGDYKEVVVKKISLGGLSEREQADALNEVKVMASLNHPNVVKYFDSFIDQTTLHIVMEYAPRGNLHDFILSYRQRSESLPDPLVWRFFLQCAVGLQHMHSRHILHRDVKTPNVFLDESCNVKLGDLGVAKVLSSHTHFAVTLVGTPYYLSPELCSNKQYNAKSDVWALGCVLYECCTQRHPFDANNQGALVLKILRGKYPMRGLHRRDPELIAVMKRCLTHDAKRRPDSTSLLRARLVRSKAEQIGIQLNVNGPVGLAAVHGHSKTSGTEDVQGYGHVNGAATEGGGVTGGGGAENLNGGRQRSSSTGTGNGEVGIQNHRPRSARSHSHAQAVPGRPLPHRVAAVAGGGVGGNMNANVMAKMKDKAGAGLPLGNRQRAINHHHHHSNNHQQQQQQIQHHHHGGSGSSPLNNNNNNNSRIVSHVRKADDEAAVAALPDVVVPERRSVMALRHVPKADREERTEYVRANRGAGNTDNMTSSSSTSGNPIVGQSIAASSEMTGSDVSAVNMRTIAQEEEAATLVTSTVHASRTSNIYVVRPPSARSKWIDNHNEGVDIAFRFGNVSVDGNNNFNRFDDPSASADTTGSPQQNSQNNGHNLKVAIDVVGKGSGGWPRSLSEERTDVGIGAYVDDGTIFEVNDVVDEIQVEDACLLEEDEDESDDSSEEGNDDDDDRTAVEQPNGNNDVVSESSMSKSADSGRSSSPSKIERSLIENITATKKQCVNLVGEDAFQQLYAVIKARATGNLADNAPSIAALSRIVFSIIGYGQAQAVTMVYHVLAAEDQLSQWQQTQK